MDNSETKIETTEFLHVTHRDHEVILGSCKYSIKELIDFYKLLVKTFNDKNDTPNYTK